MLINILITTLDNLTPLDNDITSLDMHFNKMTGILYLKSQF
jgi:hypothetical protein